MLEIIISKDSAEFLKKIPIKHAKQIVKKIDKLAGNPHAIPSVQLSGYPMLRRIKSGEYRIIYTIENNVLAIYILRIGKRNDDEVYKQLENIEV